MLKSIKFWFKSLTPRCYGQVTQVGDYWVPVKQARYVSFACARSGAHGKKEAGDYLFWTAILKNPIPAQPRTCRKVTARALAWLPPGDRFYRMSQELRIMPDMTERAAYGWLWNTVLAGGRNVALIRPATKHEVQGWLKTHQGDNDFATFRFKGKAGRC